MEGIPPELTHKLIGLAYRVYNNLGYGYQEKHYQRGFEQELRSEGIQFEKEKHIPLRYKKLLLVDILQISLLKI